jgi:uncharacterized membrane protein YadS
MLENIKKELSSKEYLPVWVGFFCFIIICITRLGFNIGPVDLKVWENDIEFINQLNSGFLGTLSVLIGITILTSMLCHKISKQNMLYSSYTIVFIILLISKYFGTFIVLKSIGLGTSFWCIILGCLVRLTLQNYGNVFLSGVMSMEFFIKCGIVLFAINIQEIASLGSKGIVVAWIDTILLLGIVYMIGIYICRMTHVETLLISSGLSICGSSAIMALSEIVEADNININASITILSLFTIPYIPIMPLICKIFGFSDVLSGVWIGGTVDSTGAVIASASLINKTVLNSAVVLKMLQNILIGPITLSITGIWYNSINPKVLWIKFPKFVLGFLIISIIVTFLPNGNIKDDCFIVSEWFSNVSFVLIGLDIDIFNLKTIFLTKWKMIVLYIIGQSIDVFTTLGFGFLMFGN